MEATLPESELSELLNQLKQGNQEAFTAIYSRFNRRIYLKVLQMVKEESVAKDVLQNVFMKIWESRMQIDLEKSFQSFLYKVAINLVYDYFRQVAKSDELRSKLTALYDDHYSHTEEELIYKDNFALVQKAISQLPPQQKQVFVLCKLEGKKYKEVSEILNISVSTTRIHLIKANQVVRAYILEHNDLALYLMVSACFLLN